MITVDTRGLTLYSPLIPAITALCNAPKGEETGNYHGEPRSLSGPQRVPVRTRHRLSRDIRRRRNDITIYHFMTDIQQKLKELSGADTAQD